MKQIESYNLPEHTNSLYKEEAISSIGLTHEIAKKINELIDAYNEFSKVDLEWKQTQEGKIRKGILYMKDNLINTLNELLKLYDKDLIMSILGAEFGKELSMLKVFATPQMFGGVGDGLTDDTNAIEKAISSLEEGGVLYFPKGTYLMVGKPIEIPTANLTFMGDGLIRCDYGFRPLKGGFKAEGLRMEGTTYSKECRAFMIDKSTVTNEAEFVEGFTFKDCYFKNFFYSVCAVGGSYSYDGTNDDIYPVRDVVIDGCYSSTYTDKNSGHFQNIQVQNISYINNRCYGGQNASSYNAIKGNGFIRVIGNYDHNNSYASCEIENGSGNTVITGNTFYSKIWVDDSYSVVVNANTVIEGILISVGSDVGDSDNIIVSNNVCRNIRCEQFGTYVGGVINNINITGNNVQGNNTHGIWLHGNSVKNAKISGNLVTGTNTNDISIQRNEQLTAYVSNNFGNGKTFLIAGTGGKVFAVDNYNVNVSGNRDPLSASHLERVYNGLRISDNNGSDWRLNISTSGEVTTIKY